MNTKLPNFLVVGAAKSATTSLHHYLSQHPNIFMPTQIKETFHLVEPKSIMGNGKGYYEKNVIEAFNDYEKLYKNVDKNKHKAIGEVCNVYLYLSENSIPCIKKRLGNPKIIIILRNPVERTYSSYLHLIRANIIHECFEDTLKKEKKRIEENWWWAFHIKSISLYAKAVKSYFEHFTDVKVIFFEDFKINPQKTLSEVYSFLNIHTSFQNDTNLIYNATGLSRNNLMKKIKNSESKFSIYIKKTAKKLFSDSTIKFLKNKFLLYKPPISKKTKQYLSQFFTEDIEELQQFLNKDLKQWLR